MKQTFSPFDPANFLDNDEIIVPYLNEALADANPDVFVAALGDVAKARILRWHGSSQLGS